MILPELFDPNGIEHAANLLWDYVHRPLHSDSPGSRPYFAGARFESFAPEVDPNRICPEDVLAVGLLDVPFPSQAILALLGDDADEAARLLRAIPTDLSFTDADDQHDLGRSSPAWQLWDLVHRNFDVGATRTSKLLARKRPHLIPIQDSVVRTRLSFDDDNYWTQLRAVWDEPLVQSLHAIRRAAGLDGQFSDLRVFDIVIWRDQAEPQDLIARPSFA